MTHSLPASTETETDREWVGRYDNIANSVNRKEIVTGVVGILVGFILGYFVALGVGSSRDAVPAVGAEGGLPHDHPTAEQMEQAARLTEVAQAEPSNREVRVQLGDTLYDMGRFDMAIPWYQEALALNPNDVNVTTDLGTCFLYTGAPDKAIEFYEKSLSIDPNHGQTMQNLGIVHFSVGEYQKAIDMWERLLETNPEYRHRDDVRKHIETARMHLSPGLAAP